MTKLYLDHGHLLVKYAKDVNNLTNTSRKESYLMSKKERATSNDK